MKKVFVIYQLVSVSNEELYKQVMKYQTHYHTMENAEHELMNGKYMEGQYVILPVYVKGPFNF